MRCRGLTVLFVLIVAPLASLATPLASPWDNMRVKHAWDAIPGNWESLGPPPPGATIDLHVVLKSDNENALIDALYGTSSPGHPKYGAHLSKEEVANHVAPHPDTLQLVRSWLTHNGIPPSSITTTHGGGWLTLSSVPVSQANQLLGASYQIYRHAGTNDSITLRTVGYALPAVLHTHVQTVAPTTSFASACAAARQQTPQRRSVGAAGSLANAAPRESVKVLPGRNGPKVVTPEFLRWLYKTSAYVPTAAGQNALGIVGFNEQYPSPTDLELFMTTYRTDAVAATYKVELVNGGGYDPSHPGIEANLNIQYAEAIAYPTPHIFYSTSGRLRALGDDGPAQDDVFLTLLVYMLSQPNVPQTVSMSCGFSENGLPLEYARTLCTLFAQLGARGVSVLFSSGNNGVGAGDCKANDGSGRVQFISRFPASCPWVTSVGGTESSLPEVAADFSGGGFSNYFPRPKYQDRAVTTFLQRLGSQNDGMYNTTGRGFPDIAAQASEYKIAIGGNPSYAVSGTSCATPTVASIISLLNDFLISYGQPPLGFLNPWLYGAGLEGLNDIISGTNPGCGTGGFPAMPGWDPVTGHGTPDFFTLQQILSRRMVGTGNQGQTLSELLNNSDTSVPYPRHRPL